MTLSAEVFTPPCVMYLVINCISLNHMEQHMVADNVKEVIMQNTDLGD